MDNDLTPEQEAVKATEAYIHGIIRAYDALHALLLKDHAERLKRILERSDE